MTINDAVAVRLLNLLDETKYSRYKVEKVGGIVHGTLDRIINGKNKTVKLTTIFKIAKVFDMSVSDFFDAPVFAADNVEFD